jgi:hypothetical protein
MTDPYWRYQGAMLARAIDMTGHLPGSYYSNHSYLLSWVNDFSDDFASPLIVAIIAEVIGSSHASGFNMPLFTPALVLSTAVISKRLTDSYLVFLLAVVLGVSHKHLIQHITLSSHRGALGWAVLFTILAALLVTTEADRKTKLLLVVPVFTVLPMAVHTLPVASLLLFTSVAALSYVSDTGILGIKTYLIGVSVIVAYNAVIHQWFGLVFYKFAVAISAVNINSLTDFFSSVQTSAGLYSGLQPYQYSFNSIPVYSEVITASNVTALALVGSIFLLRAYKHVIKYNGLNFSPLDILLVAFAIQGIGGVAILPLFASSGGFSPLTLGLLITPLFGSITLYHIHNRLVRGPPDSAAYRRKIALSVIVVLAVCAPAYGAFALKPMTESQATFSTERENVRHIQWTNSHVGEQRVFSDFNSLSRYHAITGSAKTYVPPTGSPVYSTQSTAWRVIQYYYTDPSDVRSEASVYFVSEQLQNNAMFHLGAITTEPNRHLDQQLDSSEYWNRVYSSGSSYTFVTRE